MTVAELYKAWRREAHRLSALDRRLVNSGRSVYDPPEAGAEPLVVACHEQRAVEREAWEAYRLAAVGAATVDGPDQHVGALGKKLPPEDVKRVVEVGHPDLDAVRVEVDPPAAAGIIDEALGMVRRARA